MRIRGLLRLFFAAALAGCLMGGCRCGRDATLSDGPEIDKKPLAEEYPNAPRPEVSFPARLRQQDLTLNAFIEHVLSICVRGDYDAYRQLFGTAYQPTREAQFKQVWEGVKSVEVTQVHAGPEKEQRYYVLARVHLRVLKKGRTERSVPVMVFKEGAEWRVGPAPQQVIEQLRTLDTQPATASAPTSAPMTP